MPLPFEPDPEQHSTRARVTFGLNLREQTWPSSGTDASGGQRACPLHALVVMSSGSLHLKGSTKWRRRHLLLRRGGCTKRRGRCPCRSRGGPRLRGRSRLIRLMGSRCKRVPRSCGRCSCSTSSPAIRSAPEPIFPHFLGRLLEDCW